MTVFNEWEEFAGEEDREQPQFGCDFPERCCMPGLHFPSECHTAEMMEQLMEEDERS